MSDLRTRSSVSVVHADVGRGAAFTAGDPLEILGGQRCGLSFDAITRGRMRPSHTIRAADLAASTWGVPTFRRGWATPGG
jgi:hypothetical protein